MKTLQFTIYLLLLTLICHNGFSQNADDVDSLMVVLERDLSDEERTDVYIGLAIGHANSDSALHYARKARDLATNIGYNNGRIWGILKEADEYLILEDVEKADSVYRIVISESDASGYEEGLALGYWGLTRTQFVKEEYEQAFQFEEIAERHFQKLHPHRLYPDFLFTTAHFLSESNNPSRLFLTLEKAMSYADKFQMTEAQIDSRINLSFEYTNLGNFKDALRLQLEALELDKRNGTIINNLGHIYSELGNSSKAIQYMEENVKISLEDGNMNTYHIGLLNLGLRYREFSEFDKSITTLTKALELLKEVEIEEHNLWLGRNHNDLGTTYSAADEPDKAFMHFNQAKAIMKQEEDFLGLCELYNNLAEHYIESGQFEQAAEHATKAIELGKSINYVSSIRDGSKLLSVAENGAGNFSKAYEALLLHKEISDSLINDEKKEEITRIQIEHEFKQDMDSIAFVQQKAEIAYQQEIEKQTWTKYVAFMIAVFLAIVALLAYRSYRIKQKANHSLTGKNDELKEKNREISILRETEREMAKESLAFKERELANVTMLSFEKNSLLERLENQVGKLTEKVDQNVLPDLKEIKRTIKSNLSEETWTTFTYHFEQVHPHFFETLKNRFDDLNQNDLRLCAYIKVGLNNKVIAQMNNITLAGVKKNINRLKKKLGLDAEDSLREFMLKYV